LTPPAGSTLWLLAHELRLAWRGMAAKGRGRRTLIILGLVFVGMFFVGVPLALALRGAQVPVIPVVAIGVDAAAVLVFSLMLSQTLAAATEALYVRGDLDLLFSSPIAPHKVLTVRCAAIATNVFLAFALFISPFLLPVAVIGHPAWLAVFAVMAALALAASALGLALAMALFRLIGPRRTRVVAQVLAALIGAIFFLASQARNLMGGSKMNVVIALIARASRRDFHMPPMADWLLRAMLGQPLALLSLLVVSVGLFAGATAWIGRRFAADAAAVSGAGHVQTTPAKLAGAFASGVFAVTWRKEIRLMRRDAALMSQVLLRALYLLPITFVLLRNASGHADFAVPAGVGAVTFLASQVAASLSWITLSAEDVPELIAGAPAPLGVVWRAKLIAALTPLAALLAIPLIALTAFSLRAGLAAIVGCAAASVGAGLISLWRQRPAKRSEFRRRAAASFLTGIAQLIFGVMIACAAGLAAAPSIWSSAGAMVALILSGVALAAMRRSEGEIMSGLLSGAS
jgi:ABC-2 type transport system permease protein